MKRYTLIWATGLLTAFANGPVQAQKVGKVTTPVVQTKQPFSQADMMTFVNAGFSGGQSTKLPAKTGKYGVIFQDYKVYQLYKDRILDDLDDLIEAASLNLNPSADVVANEILKTCYEFIDQQERQNKESKVDESPYFGNYAYYYATFDNSMRSALKNVNWSDYITNKAANQAGSQFLIKTIFESGKQQCVSYCSQSFFQFGWGTNGIQGAFVVASKLNYLFSYDNVAKQDNPIYKALHDTYIARQTNATLANYQPLSRYHGSQMPFGFYQLPIGKLAFYFHGGDKNKPYTLDVWDTACGCPSESAFNYAVEAKTSAFIVP